MAKFDVQSALAGVLPTSQGRSYSGNWGGGGGVYSYIRVKAGFHSENNPRIGPDRNKI